MPGRGRPYPKGTSGNPSGKPLGTKNKFKAQFEELLDKHGDIVLERLFHSAIKVGDMRAQKIIIDRKIAALKNSPICFEMPEIVTAADLPKATAALLRGVAVGEITPSEAADLAKIVDAHMTALRAVDHAVQLADIQEQLALSKGEGDSSAS